LGDLEDIAAANADKAMRPWWVMAGTQRYGPYSETEMWRFIEEGRIVMTTPCWRAEMATWQPASIPFRGKVPPPLPTHQDLTAASSPFVNDDPNRVVIGGVIQAISGFPPIQALHLCVLDFSPERITLNYIAAGDIPVTAVTLTYEEVTGLNVGGPGAITETTGGGFWGGGFGVKGAMEGILMAGVLNALTTKSRTTIETTVEFYAGSRALLLVTPQATPESLQILLTPVFARLNAINRTGNASSHKADPIHRIEELAALRERGLLSNEEFDNAKRSILDSLSG